MSLPWDFDGGALLEEGEGGVGGVVGDFEEEWIPEGREWVDVTDVALGIGGEFAGVGLRTVPGLGNAIVGVAVLEVKDEVYAAAGGRPGRAGAHRGPYSGGVGGVVVIEVGGVGTVSQALAGVAFVPVFIAHGQVDGGGRR